jgi:KDO2-lipid IV(A) lauroyltransferase
MIRMFKLLSLLPLWLLHGLGWCVGWLAFLGSATYRRRFLQNVHQAGVPAAQWLPAVGAAGKLVTELPRLWFGRNCHADLLGTEHIDAALATGRGIIFLTPHIGCFEMAAQAYALRYGSTGHPVTVLFRPPRQPWLNRLVVQSRARPGLQTAPTTVGGVRQLLKALRQGNCVALLPDQVPPHGQGLWVPFFGRDAYTMTLSARLAMQTNCAVLLVSSERLSWGRGYCVHATPMDGTPSSDLGLATAQISQAMESLVLQAPGQYLWGYARYKRPRAPENARHRADLS